MTIPFGALPVEQGGRFNAAVTSPGAGRWSDWQWPDPFTVVDTTGTPTTIRNRLNNTTLAVAVGGFGGGAAGLTIQSNTGISATVGGPLIHIGGSTIGDGQGQLMRLDAGPFGVWRVKKAPATNVLPQYNDVGVFRVYANITYDPYVSGGAIDNGLQLTSDGGLLISQAKSGFGFFRTAAGVMKVSVVPVGGGAAQTTQITTPANFDDTKEHTQEFIIMSATASSPAWFFAILDGVVKVSFAINPGVNFPDNGGVRWAYKVLIPFIQGNGAGAGLGVSAICGLKIVTAPTLAGCY